ncbi:hypothetical protein [Domibacillus tundrae]|uniref:hypothetical protein n=1 Tax=Domibacillus tundrae TaxID=1587527 RepID=UPI000617F2E4|nr:hypothetical protein [Domibacillus tundrae]
MALYTKNQLFNFFYRLIQEEKFHIQSRADNACDAIDHVIQELETMKVDLQKTHSSHIISPNLGKVYNKLRLVDHFSHDINNMKGNVRQYKDEITRFSGKWIDE